MCYLRRPHVNKSGKPWSLPDPYIILSPHHPARHLGHLHAAAGHGLHHLARVVELLLRAAMSAPSARNRRPWAFIVVDNKALLRQLADSLPYAQSAAAAPMAVVVCGVLTESQGATNAGCSVSGCRSPLPVVVHFIFRLQSIYPPFCALYPPNSRYQDKATLFCFGW